MTNTRFPELAHDLVYNPLCCSSVLADSDDDEEPEEGHEEEEDPPVPWSIMSQLAQPDWFGAS